MSYGLIAVAASLAVVFLAVAPVLIWGDKDPSQSESPHKHR